MVSQIHYGVEISHLILLRQLTDLLYIAFVGHNDQRLRKNKTPG